MNALQLRTAGEFGRNAIEAPRSEVVDEIALHQGENPAVVLMVRTIDPVPRLPGRVRHHAVRGDRQVRHGWAEQPLQRRPAPPWSRAWLGEPLPGRLRLNQAIERAATLPKAGAAGGTH